MTCDACCARRAHTLPHPLVAPAPAQTTCCSRSKETQLLHRIWRLLRPEATEWATVCAVSAGRVATCAACWVCGRLHGRTCVRCRQAHPRTLLPPSLQVRAARQAGHSARICERGFGAGGYLSGLVRAKRARHAERGGRAGQGAVGAHLCCRPSAPAQARPFRPLKPSVVCERALPTLYWISCCQLDHTRDAKVHCLIGDSATRAGARARCPPFAHDPTPSPAVLIPPCLPSLTPHSYWQLHTPHQFLLVLSPSPRVFPFAPTCAELTACLAVLLPPATASTPAAASTMAHWAGGLPSALGARDAAGAPVHPNDMRARWRRVCRLPQVCASAGIETAHHRSPWSPHRTRAVRHATARERTRATRPAAAA